MVNMDTGTELRVKEHIILRNFWEYYVLDQTPVEGDDDIFTALVIGFEQEIGDVSRNEIKPYIISKTKNLGEVMPAPGYKWKEAAT
jgi:hypothetical protein